jgi:hypothetical protein
MKIIVKVKAGAKENMVEKIGDNEFIVKVKEPAKENKANFAVIEAISDYFNVSFSAIRIISGKTSKQKVFEIIER